MPDISMCLRSDCPLAESCYRYLATPSPYRQAYAAFEPEGCESYIPVEEAQEVTP